MTAIEHAILATFLLFIAHKWGEWKGRREKLEDVIESTLITLEDGDYIRCKVDANGEKELIKISEIKS
jgi:hypothetical protein